MYIHIYRERVREREREKGREKESGRYLYIKKYGFV